MAESASPLPRARSCVSAMVLGPFQVTRGARVDGKKFLSIKNHSASFTKIIRYENTLIFSLLRRNINIIYISYKYIWYIYVSCVWYMYHIYTHTPINLSVILKMQLQQNFRTTRSKIPFTQRVVRRVQGQFTIVTWVICFKKCFKLFFSSWNFSRIYLM